MVQGEFVGRRRELAYLRGWLTAAVEGQPRLVLCGGEPGIGKTRLASELAKVASTSYGAGVHWADQPSLLLLRHLARELREVRLLVVATYRTTRADTTAGWRAVLSDLIREPLTEQVELSGLSAADTARCAEAVSDRPVSGAVGAALHSMTGGNPFFVREVARSLAISAGSDVTVPASVIDLITARVERLSPLTRRLLGAAAVLGEQFAVAIAASLIEPQPDHVMGHRPPAK